MSTNQVARDFFDAAFRSGVSGTEPGVPTDPHVGSSLAVRAPPLECVLGPNDGGLVARTIGSAMVPLVRSMVRCCACGPLHVQHFSRLAAFCLFYVHP